jgi:hypothetical protein
MQAEKYSSMTEKRRKRGECKQEQQVLKTASGSNRDRHKEKIDERAAAKTLELLRNTGFNLNI